jgi:hypothetical protein
MHVALHGSKSNHGTTLSEYVCHDDATIRAWVVEKGTSRLTFCKYNSVRICLSLAIQHVAALVASTAAATMGHANPAHLGWTYESLPARCVSRVV